MSRRGSSWPLAAALIYGAVVVVTMVLSLWPERNGPEGMIAVILSLPWGLLVILILDTINPALISSLGPPLIAMFGLLNAALLHRTFKSR